MSTLKWYGLIMGDRVTKIKRMSTIWIISDIIVIT